MGLSPRYYEMLYSLVPALFEIFSLTGKIFRKIQTDTNVTKLDTFRNYPGGS
ncbi:hypothetical protein LEP1GSC061_3390 [Leptospira wolffii serovar Khorat str. Khorat-H2]|nr:hypothetical protein LEP1GSC061_3390 [Leptospira wolffii serovar Khorat str. Khorat-H2]